MMKRHPDPEQLMEFPCDHLFKAFGPHRADGRFEEEVRCAVSEVVPVSADALSVRVSSRETYACVTVKVRLENFAQLRDVYAALRRVADLKYLL
jgi:putative lipoic acid-binding regulatory protein